MNKLIQTTITALTISLLSNCSSRSNGNGTHSEGIYLTTLNEVPYRISTLEKGTPLKLIAFAGGNQNDKEWTPAMQNGKAVPMTFTQPVSF